MLRRILTWWGALMLRARCLLIAVAIALIGLQFSPPLGNGPEAGHAAAAQAKNDPLEGGVAWLNTENQLSLAELRGRVVLLDFWTLC